MRRFDIHPVDGNKRTIFAEEIKYFGPEDKTVMFYVNDILSSIVNLHNGFIIVEIVSKHNELINST